MSRAALRLGKIFGAMACLLDATSASADVAEADARLTYEASGRGCPSEETYRAEAQKRIPAQTEHGRTLEVHLGPSARGFEGTVEAIERSAGSPRVVASRTVEGATCQDVADATLLLVALGVLEAPQAPPEESPPPPPPLVVEPPSEPRPMTTFHVAGVALAASGFGPAAFGGGARAGVGIERHGIFRPELRAGVDVVADAQLKDSIGTAARSLIAGRMDVCPVALGARFSLRPCAAGALGEIHVRGENVPSPRDERRLYGAIGGLVRGQVRLIGGLGVEVSLGVLAPLLAHRFYFEPNAVLFRMNHPIVMLEGGLSWSIP